MNFNLLIPDDRAHGRSEGKYIGFGCLDRKDCLAWCRYITKTFGNDCRIFLHGVSMGASTVLATSGDPALLPQIKGIIADCGFSRGWDELKYILKKTYHLPSFPLLNLFDRICRAKAGYSTKEYSPIEQVVHSVSRFYLSTAMRMISCRHRWPMRCMTHVLHKTKNFGSSMAQPMPAATIQTKRDMNFGCIGLSVNI